jgi:hypothetical protein
MKADAMVYYLYTDQRGVETKFAAVVLEEKDDGLLVRVGRFDVHSKEISTFESVVSKDSLQPRSVPCSYEDELKGLA